MDKYFFSEGEKKKREQEALKEHARLAKLFQENRFMFELERRREIERCIKTADPDVQPTLQNMQRDLDIMLKGAKTPENRLALIRATLNHHVINKFIPALNAFRKQDAECNYEPLIIN